MSSRRVATAQNRDDLLSCIPALHLYSSICFTTVRRWKGKCQRVCQNIYGEKSGTIQAWLTLRTVPSIETFKLQYTFTLGHG